MVDQWATDITAGHDTALLAWRRQDVADLNRLARARYDQLGHLHGEDLTAPGGRRYATGDRVVTLAPNPTAHLVDRKSVVEGKSVSVRVDLGGLRIIKKKK